MFDRKFKKKGVMVILCAAVLGAGSIAGLSALRKTSVDERMPEYSNPISSVEGDTWDDYGTGDPYVMRYNGKYYLYISTRDDETGIKCFSSKNLADWKYENLCAEENITQGAYAPEVVYYNGKFYMYTSPAGKGHYVLESESPIGPFKRVTDNVGLSIDGSVFIDDDGKWYFYHASEEGIAAHEMSSPIDISEEMIDVNAKMNGWTEGPMVIKTDGKYYLTYTGNHVLSRGYRINYGVGDSPVSFTESRDNPLLIHTMDEPYGIGHSSSVKGPDLDSYYIVYHSLTGRSVEGMPKRVMNIDRIVFNGEKMDVLGPTVTPQQMPFMPEIYSYFNTDLDKKEWGFKNVKIAEEKLHMSSGGHICSKGTFGEDFTAEYNVSSVESTGCYGGYFNYIDKENYGRFKIEPGKQAVAVELMCQGEMQTEEFRLNGSFGEPVDLTVNQTFQVEKSGEGYQLYLQDRLMGEFKCMLSGGSIGYYAEGCNATFGFLGGTGTAGGKSAGAYEKPIPGTVQGIHFADCSNIMTDQNVCENTEIVVSQGESSSADYVIRADRDGMYNFSMMYASDQDTSYELYVDGKLITSKKEPLLKTGGLSDFNTARLEKLELEEGTHILKICFYGENVAMSEFHFAEYEDVEEIDWNKPEQMESSYSDGSWEYQNGTLVIDDGEDAVGKILYGRENWADYSVKADFTFLSENQDAGLLVRARNPSLGGAGDDALAGTCFVQGYYIALKQGKVVLEKLNYSEEILAQADIKRKENYEIQVKAEGTKLSVYIDGKECIAYEDQNNPFLQGAAGIRTYLSSVRVEKFEVFSDR